MRTIICKQCGKEKRIRDALIKQEFCSHKCFDKSRERKVRIVCKQCGKSREVYLSRSKQKFCSRVCQSNFLNSDVIIKCDFCGKEKIIKRWESKTSTYHFCNKQCAAWKKMVAVKIYYCIRCGKVCKKPKTIVSKAEYCINCWIELNRNKPRGEFSWNWKGGKTSERLLIFKRKEYIEWRKKIYKRDNYTCQLCGERGHKLNAHHIYKVAEAPELVHDINNGITLCYNCHTKKVNQHESDFVEMFLMILDGANA